MRKKRVYMLQIDKKIPVFISLALVEPTTDELFTELKGRIPGIFSALRCEFLDSPFRHFSDLRIGSKRKREFTPVARMYIRRGLFYEFNATEVQPVFEGGADIVLVRHFGFDLIAGALAWKDCPRTLVMHKKLVPFDVNELGLHPPLYVFTDQIDDRTRTLKDQYFSIPGQRCEVIDPNLPLEQKADVIITMIRTERRALVPRDREAAVA